MNSALWLLMPDEMLPLVFAAGALAIIAGAAKFGRGLIVAAMVLTILPLAFEPLFDAALEMLPAALLVLLAIWLALALAFACLRGVLAALIGSRGSDLAVAQLAAEGTRYVVAMPFRLAWWLVRKVLALAAAAARRR